MKQTKWNLQCLFENDHDPRIDKNRKMVQKKSYEFITKWKDRKDYLRKPAVLKEALDEYEQWKSKYGTDGDEGYYFWLRTSQDQSDPNLKAKFNKVEEFSKQIANDIQFFLLRVAKIPQKYQKDFIDYPGLKTYRHFLERSFMESKYLLSEPVEKIMNLKSSTSHSNWVKMTSSFLAKEERDIILENGRKAKKSFAEILSLLNSKKREVRDTAAKALNEILRKNVSIAEVEINSVLANKKIDDQLRKIPRPDITRHMRDDIESDIVDSLIRSVSDRFSISERFYQLRAKLFHVRKLKYHERNVEYGNINRKYSFSESIRIIRSAFQKLDRQFVEILERFIREGQFDIYPRKGKVSGAFCSHYLITHPTFILLNHTDRLRDVLTLAHELGHGINNELIREKQNALNFGTPTSTAEVASTFMEDFVLQEILKRADDRTRLSLMIMKLNDDISSIFRQVACYRFEQELHHNFREKGYLSKEDIGKLFQKHMSSYMGKSVEQSAGSENWWVYWGHIRSFFYVYSYSSGLLISKSLQNSVKNNPGFIMKVKDFLSAGLSDSPKNIFKKLGVDITDKTFWDRGLDEVESLLGETIALAKKLGKI